AGELIVANGHVTPQTIVSMVYDMFCNALQLEALVLTDDNKPVGLITRTKLLFTLSRKFGYELHARHAIVTIADTSRLIVSENEALDVIIDKAFTRAPQDIYDEIIVTRSDGTYLGLLSVKQLVIQQSNVLARSIL